MIGADYIIVDGYNVINNWDKVFDLRNDSLSECRDRFSRMMENFAAYLKSTVIIVFDAYKVSKKGRTIENQNNLEIIYTKKGETADEYIERFVNKNAKSFKIYVVTNDIVEQNMVIGSGAFTISTAIFLLEVNKVSHKISKASLDKKGYKNKIINRLDTRTLDNLKRLLDENR